MWTGRSTSNRALAVLSCLAIGAVVAAAHLVSGDTDDAAKSFLLMTAIALILAVGGRSRAVRAVRGEGRDERSRSVDLRAAAGTAGVLIAVSVALTLWKWAHDDSGTPYVQLVALGAGAYVSLVIIFNRRT